MKKLTLPQSIIIVAIIICFSMVFNSLCNRYYVDSSLNIKIDKLTGKTYTFNNSNNSWDLMHTSKKTDNTLVEIDSTKDYSEDIKNIKLLMDSNIYFSFKTDYEVIINNIKNNPLAYSESSFVFLPKYKKYSPLINTYQITKAYLEKDIDNSWDFINYLLKSIENN